MLSRALILFRSMMAGVVLLTASCASSPAIVREQGPPAQSTRLKEVVGVIVPARIDVGKVRASSKSTVVVKISNTTNHELILVSAGQRRIPDRLLSPKRVEIGEQLDMEIPIEFPAYGTFTRTVRFFFQSNEFAELKVHGESIPE
jgi:hypothetical protein